jgi:3-hydroxyacyl-CoA dehydrogenase/enoyl-CoA hydratase/3-hydroxybutyryl-CoA epimerase
VPFVCAIHGACAGGGFELALACHWRIASDAAATQIGLPEIGLGTIPGWGGTVRLPRLVGVKAALDHVLKAQLLGAAEAVRRGLVDEAVPAEELRVYAKEVAVTLARAGVPARRAVEPVDETCYAEFRQASDARFNRRYRAPWVAIDAVQQSIRLPIAEALQVEARAFGSVTVSESCRNLIRAFFLRDAAKKRSLAGWFSSQSKAKEIKRAGVVGAGIMGSGIAHWLAHRGISVVMRDVQTEALERGRATVQSLLEDEVKRGRVSAAEATTVMKRVATTTAWDGFENCDLVIEAIVENTAAKQALFTELAGVVREDALLASNTSALPIEEIAGHVPNPARTLGIHFFNPVSRMPLVELIIGRETTAEAAETALAFVKGLGKSPVICRSSPGFLVTRVLFFYLNEAIRHWEQGETTAAIDAALRDFGWPMGPLRLIDEVGVDVTDFIFGEMEHYFPQRFRKTQACARLLAAGLKGRKNGASRGFYRYDGRKESVNEAETRSLTKSADKPAATLMAATDLTRDLMRTMVDEARRCLDEGVVKSADDVDFALLSGTGFPAFRGGLMHWAASGAVI